MTTLLVAITDSLFAVVATSKNVRSIILVMGLSGVPDGLLQMIARQNRVLTGFFRFADTLCRLALFGKSYVQGKRGGGMPTNQSLHPNKFCHS